MGQRYHLCEVVGSIVFRNNVEKILSRASA